MRPCASICRSPQFALCSPAIRSLSRAICPPPLISSHCGFRRLPHQQLLPHEQVQEQPRPLEQLPEPSTLAIPHRGATATLMRHRQLPPFNEQPTDYFPSPLSCCDVSLRSSSSCRTTTAASLSSSPAVATALPRRSPVSSAPSHRLLPPSCRPSHLAWQARLVSMKLST
jgi:hypothetical protein